MVPPNHGLACTQTSDAGPPEASVTVPLMLPPVASAGTAGAATTTPAASVAAAATPRTSRRMLPPRQRNDPAPLGMRRRRRLPAEPSTFGSLCPALCGGPGELLGGPRRGG